MGKETMKALRMYAPGDFRYEDVPVPKIDDDEILVKIEGCGICAGDVKTLHGGVRIWGTTPEKRYIEAPVIGGHEFVGRVVKYGKNVAGVLQVSGKETVWFPSRSYHAASAVSAKRVIIPCVRDITFTGLRRIRRADLPSI